MKSNRYKHLGHKDRSDAIRHDIAKKNFKFQSFGRHRDSLLFKETEGHTYVFRGELDPDIGAFYKNVYKGFPLIESDKRYWTNLVQVALRYTLGGSSIRLLAAKVSEDTELFPFELSFKETKSAKVKLEILNNKLPKLSKLEVEAITIAVNGVKIKDLKEWKNKYLPPDEWNHSSQIVNILPNELRLKTDDFEVLTINRLRNNRSFYRTKDGTTVATRGLRKTDMFIAKKTQDLILG